MFKCECGKEFENPQSFNGHKSHCKIHLSFKYDSPDKWEPRLNAYKTVLQKNCINSHEQAEERKKSKLDI